MSIARAIVAVADSVLLTASLCSRKAFLSGRPNEAFDELTSQLLVLVQQAAHVDDC